GAVVLARRSAGRRDQPPRAGGPGAPARRGGGCRGGPGTPPRGPLEGGGGVAARYFERLKRVPLRAGGFRLFRAHQMGTCRMGADPQTSVANPYGGLHDTPGGWVGEAGAFPSASGTTPMITIMALAHRTGEAILTT